MNTEAGAYTFPDTEPTTTPEIVIEETKQPVEPVPEYAQITEEAWNKLQTSVSAFDDIKAENKRLFDTAFGRLGGIQQYIDQLRNQTDEGVQITDEDVSDLAEEYPDLGALQLKVLRKVASKLRGTGSSGINQDQVLGIVDGHVKTAVTSASDNAVVRAKSEMASETLDETHTGWRDVIGMPDTSNQVPTTEFRKWLATQPQDYQKKVNDSYSPVVIGKAIDAFRDSQKKAQKPQARARERILEAAVSPRGTGATTSEGLSPEEQMSAGYR